MEIIMKPYGLDNWMVMASQMQKPFQEMLDLNVNTFKNLNYLTFQDISSMKDPGELFNKHMKLLMKNSQMMLDYLEQSYQLWQSSLLPFSKPLKENAVQFFKDSNAELSENKKDDAVSMLKMRKSTQSKNMETRNETAAPQKKTKSAKKKTESKTASLQNKVVPEQKTVKSIQKQQESAPKKTIPKSIKETPKRTQAKSNSKNNASFPQINAEKKQNEWPELSKNISDKPKKNSKLKMTQLERKMQMPDPKAGLLLNEMSIHNEPVDLKELDVIPEHHIIHTEHPMPEQEGKGKNPFKK